MVYLNRRMLHVKSTISGWKIRLGNWFPNHIKIMWSNVDGSIRLSLHQKALLRNKRIGSEMHSQHEGIDYIETFNPITKMNSIQVNFSLVYCFVWVVHNRVCSDLLYGDRTKDIYME